ncbi:hypothetical protein BN946_scf184633.g4 [Trametes cinnabarina]|uniref:Uncharacterized protein n=1 Tax=Pycnoporus cinnabarinus TaxID=5643 RepID=A0A060SLH1_PYCCI|nr:hypothetical protein BN946_scf184633.g4 [Trametes cinnabarina]
MLANYSTDSEVTLSNSSRDSPPSPRSVHAKLDSVSLSPPKPPRRLPSASARRQTVQSAVTHFVMTPHSHAHIPQPTQPTSLLTRLMSVIKNNAPSHSYSFTLSPLPSAPLPQSSSVGVMGVSMGAGANPLTPTPLLTFHDRTPVWTAHCNSGLIEMDERQVRVLGVEPAFYVAVALTYLEFLQERESYLVAAYD